MNLVGGFPVYSMGFRSRRTYWEGIGAAEQSRRRRRERRLFGNSSSFPYCAVFTDGIASADWSTSRHIA